MAGGLDALSKVNLQQSGVGDYGESLENGRGVYPAIVVPFGTNDNTEQNRIKVRIVSLDDNGNIIGKNIENSLGTVSQNAGKKESTVESKENYDSFSGKDRGIRDTELVICMPLLPEFFHIRPQVGEMVFVIFENPTDNASVRYWIGPIISSKLKLNYQSYEDSVKIFNKTTFVSNKKTDNSAEIANLFPTESDVAIQGRNDADLILKNREALLTCGKFDRNTFSVNLESPSYLILKQFDDANIAEANPVVSKVKQSINVELLQDSASGKFVGTIIVKDIKSNIELKREFNNLYSTKSFTINWLKEKIKEEKTKYPNWSFTSNVDEFKKDAPAFNSKAIPSPEKVKPPTNDSLLKKYSQATLTSTNINIYSQRGKFRGDSVKGFEKNNDLKSFGKLADSLHPSVFGDELVRLLDLIIRLLLTHIHTPQMPPVSVALSDELKKYTVSGWLQNILSNHVRIN